MKTIGMIGGMSWESTVHYYKIVNTVVKQKLGGLHSAQCLLYSVDFHDIEQCQVAGDWETSAAILTDAARRLEKAGADFVVICTNTMHKVADHIRRNISIPILHIADVTADALLQAGITSVGLLGTKYTMEQDFYTSRLKAKGLTVLVPDAADRQLVNTIIYDELCLGKISPASRQTYIAVINKLAVQGAQGVILGCTEIGLLVQQEHTSVPLFDTTLIHATGAALYALE